MVRMNLFSSTNSKISFPRRRTQSNVIHIFVVPLLLLLLFCLAFVRPEVGQNQWELHHFSEFQWQPVPINVNNPGPDSQVDIAQLRPDFVDPLMRNALRANAQNRWIQYKAGQSKYTIPYVISGSFREEERQTIRKAMHSIDKHTCIRFRPRKGEADYVDIQNQAGQGCYTMVGMMRGQNQLMMESSMSVTCILFPTVVHELMHKIGLWHEQMRYDRDKYIKVHWENIPQNLQSQFAKVPHSVTSVYGVRYDYKSVMHYTKNAFASSPARVTMETKKKQYQDVIGTAQRASRGDWTKICAMYKCSRCMGKAFTRTKKTKKTRKKSGKAANKKGQRHRQRNIVPTWLGRDSPAMLLPPAAGEGVSNTSASSIVDSANDSGESFIEEHDESSSATADSFSHSIDSDDDDEENKEEEEEEDWKEEEETEMNGEHNEEWTEEEESSEADGYAKTRVEKKKEEEEEEKNKEENNEEEEEESGR